MGLDGSGTPASSGPFRDLFAGLNEASLDPNDPAFAPIEGVDLEGYARAVAAITRSDASQATAEQVAETAGIPAGKWKAVNEGWIARMRQSRTVMNRYGVIFGKY